MIRDLRSNLQWNGQWNGRWNGVHLKLAIRNLGRNPRRTVALLITLSLGTGALFLFRAFNHGIMNQYRENTIHSRYGHGHVQSRSYRDTVYEKPWEHWISNWESIANTLKALAEVSQVFPRVEFSALITHGNISLSGRGQGVNGEEESRFFNTLNIEEGETLSSQPDGILLGKGLARALNVRINDRVTVLSNTIHGSINGLDLKVVGIFHTGAKDFDDTMFRIPIRQALGLLDTLHVETLAISLKADQDWSSFARKLELRYPHLESTPFEVLDKIYYQHSVDWLRSQFSIIQMIIISIVLLGIFNSISTSIFERKQEIGVLRANGESRMDILSLLTREGLLIGVLGGILGVTFTYLLTQLFLSQGILMPPAPGLTRQFKVLFEFETSMALSAMALCLLTTWIGTTLACLKIIRVPISELLRSL